MIYTAYAGFLELGESAASGQKIAIFQKTLYISDKIPTKGCKSPTEKIMNSKNFAANFFSKMRIIRIIDISVLSLSFLPNEDFATFPETAQMRRKRHSAGPESGLHTSPNSITWICC